MQKTNRFVLWVVGVLLSLFITSIILYLGVGWLIVSAGQLNLPETALPENSQSCQIDADCTIVFQDSCDDPCRLGGKKMTETFAHPYWQPVSREWCETEQESVQKLRDTFACPLGYMVTPLDRRDVIAVCEKNRCEKSVVWNPWHRLQTRASFLLNH